MSGTTVLRAARWVDVGEHQMSAQVRASDTAGIYGSMTKVLRMVLQSAVLGLGAYLVIQGQATAGACE